MIEIRPLAPAEIDRAGEALPLHRLGSSEATYLIAWENDAPVGHAHIAWTRTELGLPELQDFFVLPAHRNRGIGTQLTQAAERLAAERGHDRCSLSVSVANHDARRLYERLGYRLANRAPKRVRGTIQLRGVPHEVDDTLLYFTKPVDLAAARSS